MGPGTPGWWDGMLFWTAAPSSRLFCTRTFVAALAIALLLATLCQSQAADPEPKRVLMLHSFGPRFKPWSDYAQAIRSEISQQRQKPVDFLDHSLVNARESDENSEAAFVEYLRTLYASRPIDLIVAIGAPAANFVQRHRQRLFSTTPMVFTAVEQRRIQYEKLTENDTVVAVAHDFPAAFDNILRVLPLTKTIAVVNGASPNETFWQEEMRRELAPLTGRVELRWYNEKSFEEILKDAANTSASQRDLLASDECRCGGGCARGERRSEQTLLLGQRANFLVRWFFLR